MLLSNVQKAGKYIITGIKKHQTALDIMELGLTKDTVIEVLDIRSDGAALVRVRGDMLSVSRLPCSLVEVRNYGG